MKKLLIKNPTILNEGRRFVGSLLIEGDKISRIGEGDVTGDPAFEADEVIDATGKWLLPGVIDDQVHFRDPGLTHKGDGLHFSAASARELGKRYFEAYIRMTEQH